MGLVKCVEIIVLHYFSIDGEWKREHFFFDPGDDCSNFICGNNKEIMYDYLIWHCSHPVRSFRDVNHLIVGKDSKIVGVDDIGETVTVEGNLREGIVRDDYQGFVSNYEEVLQHRVCTVIS